MELSDAMEKTPATLGIIGSVLEVNSFTFANVWWNTFH
jgi:hypothetical protein